VSPAHADTQARLVERLRGGDERAVARCISVIESAGAAGRSLLAALRPLGGRASVVGVTGAPGSGKSTLVDGLIGLARRAAERVAVVAVDPSSPYSGGALLGDRIRMGRWHDDPDVFVRSMAARGHSGGLARATLHAVAVLDAAGFDRILIETVGVGQSEVEVAAAADTTVVVLTPGQGDAIQAVKAGLMEIADVFVVNKADLPGAERVVADVREALSLGPDPAAAWQAPVLSVSARNGEGLDALAAAIAEHQALLRSEPQRRARVRRRARAEVAAALACTLRHMLETLPAEALDAVAAGERDVDDIARALLASLGGDARVD